MKAAQLTLFAVLFFFIFQIKETDAQNRIKLNRTSNEIKLDGDVDVNEWNDANKFSPVQYKPVNGAEPSTETLYFITYDENYIYVAGIMSVDNISNNSFKRDLWGGNSDVFGISLDTFNDKENGLLFYTTPSSARNDAATSEDGYALNKNWNTYFDAATQITDYGWSTELRIPFTSLRYNAQNEKIVMGFSIQSYNCELQETSTYPMITDQYGDEGIDKTSLFSEFEIENIEESLPLYISAYALAGRGFTNSASDDGFDKESINENEAGLNLKYGLSENLTMDLTLNTDFAQVEADYNQINLTRYSLFFPEKRQFFQERAGVFDFNFNSAGTERVFYSRRIGLNNGKPIRILGGIRGVGKLGDWDIGVLTMQTGKEDEFASENFSVLRIKEQIINPNSNIGAILTSRNDADGNYNYVIGGDLIIRLTESDYISAKAAHSFDHSLGKSVSLDNSRLRFNLRNRSSEGFGYALSYGRAGKNYIAGIGFEPRKDFSYYGVGTWYGWRPEGSLYHHGYNLVTRFYTRNSDNKVESASSSLGWMFETKSGHWFFVKYIRDYENVFQDFDIENRLTIPESDYSFGSVSVGGYTPEGNWYYINYGAAGGNFYDGEKWSANLDIDFTITNRFVIGSYYQYDKIIIDKRDERLESQLFRINAEYMFSTELSVIGLVQYSNITKRIDGNFKIRYNPREGVDLYLVYNESSNHDRVYDRYSLPKYNYRNLILKYVYTF